MADSGMIKTVFAGIIMVAILGYVVALIYPMLGTGGRDYTSVTLNSDLSDNTGTSPDNWDNYVENNATNAWNTGEYLTTTVTDNLNLYENGIWHQSLSVSSIYDEVSSATLAFKWRLIDNDNLSAIKLTVYLDDGSENTLIWSSENKENTATWSSQENSVTSVVDAAGTYTVYLRAEIKPDSTKAASNIIAGWDDTSLTVVAHEEYIGEKTQPLFSSYVPVIVTILLIGFFVAGVAMLLRHLGMI